MKTTENTTQNDDPEPLDKRTKAHREWVKRQSEKPEPPPFPPTPTLNPDDPNAKIVETPLAEALPEVPPPPAPPLNDTVPVLPPPPNPPPNAATNHHRFFRKVSVGMPLYVEKARIQFEVLDQNMGVIKLNSGDSKTIDFLAGLAKARKGGVTEIDEEKYIELKKNLPFQTSAPRSQPQKLRIWESRPKKLNPSVNPNVAAVNRSPVAGSGGSAASVTGVAGAGTPATPTSFAPNLRPKSGVLKTPSSGKFRADAGLPPTVPQ